METQAYVNHGRWIADCPRDDCQNAERLDPGQTQWHCSYCQLLGTVTWPSDPDGIWDALQVRPVPSTRNWYPEGHVLGERMNQPTGQTVTDLTNENKEHGV